MWFFPSKVTVLLVSTRSHGASTTSGIPTKDVEAEQPLISPLQVRRIFFTDVPGNTNKNIYL